MASNLDLALEYFEAVLGQPIDTLRPEPVSGWDVVEALWPLNELFRPHLARIRSIRYDAAYEAAADDAIEAYVAAPKARTWRKLKPKTWRVLLERHQQMLTVALANELEGNRAITRLPHGLPELARLPGLMLLLLHGMTLPFPPEDRSALELPEGATPESLWLH